MCSDMNIELTADLLRKKKENDRFKLWWALVQVLSQDKIVEMNRELGASFFPPDKVIWIEKEQPNYKFDKDR